MVRLLVKETDYCTVGKTVHSNILLCYVSAMMQKSLKKRNAYTNIEKAPKDQQQNVKVVISKCLIFLYIFWCTFHYTLNEHILLLQLDFLKQCYLNKLYQ